jgi:hypothetical protein
MGRGVIDDVSARVVETFAQNLAAMLAPEGARAVAAPEPAAPELARRPHRPSGASLARPSPGVCGTRASPGRSPGCWVLSSFYAGGKADELRAASLTIRTPARARSPGPASGQRAEDERLSRSVSSRPFASWSVACRARAPRGRSDLARAIRPADPSSLTRRSTPPTAIKELLTTVRH